VKVIDLTLPLIAIALLGFVGKGILTRAGKWSAQQWMGFLIRLIICVGLTAVPFVLPLQSLNPAWPFAARLVYFATEMALMMYGIFSGVWLLKAFAGGDAQPPWVVNAMVFAFTALTLAFGGAVWLEHTAGIAYQQTGAVVLGLFCVWIGATLPEWVQQNVLYMWLSDIVSEKGARLLYTAAGLVLVGLGILGRAHIFR
jgi:hypothetical protein